MNKILNAVKTASGFGRFRCLARQPPRPLWLRSFFVLGDRSELPIIAPLRPRAFFHSVKTVRLIQQADTEADLVAFRTLIQELRQRLGKSRRGFLLGRLCGSVLIASAARAVQVQADVLGRRRSLYYITAMDVSTFPPDFIGVVNSVPNVKQGQEPRTKARPESILNTAQADRGPRSPLIDEKRRKRFAFF